MSAKLLTAAYLFADVWQAATRIRREIYACRCTEYSRASEADNDPGTPPCYVDREADPELMCEPCVKRLEAMGRLKLAKKAIISARGKLLRLACQPTHQRAGDLR